MPIFDSPPLSSDFKAAIHQAFSGETDWKTIIEYFGTHYIKQTILGGRTHLQHKIKEPNIRS
jgi:hypothetical protein